MTQSSLQAAAIMYPRGMLLSNINLSNYYEDLYVSNTPANLDFPLAGLITTMCNPRIYPFSFYSISTIFPFIDIYAKFPPSNPADLAYMTKDNYLFLSSIAYLKVTSALI